MQVSSSRVTKLGSKARTSAGPAASRPLIPHSKQQVITCASSGGVRGTSSNEKNDNRTRQEIEQAYYEEWERLTLIPEEELNRPMTPSTFLKFLPMWLRYNALPGPVRYLLFKDKIGSSGGQR